MKKKLTISALTIVTLVAITFFGVKVWIRADVNKIADSAIEKYPGDRIEAMICLLKDENQDLRTKNHAIWALGQLRDKRALTTLKSLQTDSECHHQEFVCQREIEKAIANTERRGINLFIFK